MAAPNARWSLTHAQGIDRRISIKFEMDDEMSRVVAILDFCVIMLGPGRTSIKGGICAMIAAPLVAVLAFPVPLMVFLTSNASFHYSSVEDLDTFIMILAATLAAAAAVTVAFGMPVWAISRAIQRESGYLYCSTGALSGLVPPYLLLRGGTEGAFASASNFPLYVFSSAAGILGALAFWVIARESPAHVK
jgi:hypothetical protein